MKVAYEPSRDLSTGWTDDGSIIAVGLGNYQSAAFAILYGQISNGTDKAGFTVESATKVSFYSNDHSQRLAFDQTDPAMITFRSYENDVFQFGWGIYSQGSQTYVGTFASDVSPTLGDLKDVHPIDVKHPIVATNQTTLLERIFDVLISPARAQSDDTFGNLNGYVLLILAAASLMAAISIVLACKASALACLLVAIAFAIALSKARADEAPPHIYPQSEPPAGTIPYGAVIYVDDGTCPAGQIKRVIGGNDQQGIPRMRSCVTMPATIP
jgi:hypothetical protein